MGIKKQGLWLCWGFRKKILTILQPVTLEYQRKYVARIIAMVQVAIKPLVIILAHQITLGNMLQEESIIWCLIVYAEGSDPRSSLSEYNDGVTEE